MFWCSRLCIPRRRLPKIWQQTQQRSCREYENRIELMMKSGWLLAGVSDNRPVLRKGEKQKLAGDIFFL